MRNCQRHFFHYKSNARQILFCLALVAFIARAFIPQGYMPDTQAMQQGKLQLMLCDMETRMMAHHHGMSHTMPQHNPSSTHHDLPSSCLYHFTVTQAVIDSIVLLPFDITLHKVAQSNTTIFIPQYKQLYIPLGSRAPPRLVSASI